MFWPAVSLLVGGAVRVAIVAVKVILWVGPPLMVAGAVYTGYDVAQSVVEASDGARRSSGAARDAAEEFQRSGSGEGLDDLQQDYTEGQLAQHRAVGRASGALTENLLTTGGSLKPGPGPGPPFSANTLTTLDRLQGGKVLGDGLGTAAATPTATAVSSGRATASPTAVSTRTPTSVARASVTPTATARVTPVPARTPTATSAGAYVGELVGVERLLKEGRITANSATVEVSGRAVTFSARFVILDELATPSGRAGELCRMNAETSFGPAVFTLSPSGSFGGELGLELRTTNWRGCAGFEGAVDKSQFDTYEVDGRVDGDLVEGAISYGEFTWFSFTLER